MADRDAATCPECGDSTPNPDCDRCWDDGGRSAATEHADTVRRFILQGRDRVFAPGPTNDALAALDALLAEREQMLTDLQTCLHLLAEEGYIADPDYPEVDAILARYESAVGAT